MFATVPQSVSEVPKRGRVLFQEEVKPKMETQSMEQDEPSPNNELSQMEQDELALHNDRTGDRVTGTSLADEDGAGPSESQDVGQHATRGREKRRPSSRPASQNKSPGPSRQQNSADRNNGAFGGANCRYDSSLGLLTKKFVALVEGAPDGVLDLNKAAESLQVQKRRIYDITNVLEGIGLIEKKSKNNVQWRGSAPAASEELDAEFKALQDDVNALNEDSLLLERHIKELQANVEEMTDHPANKARLYVTNDDIIKLRSIGEDVVFAVTAPHGTTLVVPDPDECIEEGGQRRYRAILTSKSEAIGVWLVSATHHAANEAMRADLGSQTAAAGPSQEPTLKLEDQNHGMTGPTANSLLHGMAMRGAENIPHQAIGSPNTFMKLETPDMDPECWFNHEKQPLGVGDIFAEPAM